MTDMSKYKNVSLQKKTYTILEALSKVLLPDGNLSISKTIEVIANEKARKLNGNPSDDFRDISEVHQCWDCDSEGEYYEIVDDSNLIGDANDDDGDTHSIN